MIGRRTERRLLDAWAAEAFDGAFRVVLVTGDEGMGKSALVDAAIAGWASGNVRILAGHCQEDSSVPALPVLTALGGLVDAPLVGAADVSPVARAPATAVLLADALVAEARRHPVVLRIDDVHWADTATVELLTHLLQTVAHRRLVEPLSLLVVLGARAPMAGTPPQRFLDRVVRDDATSRLPLEPLPELDVNALLASLVGGPPSRRLLVDVADVAEGNPLFVRTLVEHLVARDALRFEDGEVVATGPVAPEYAHLDAVVADRLGSLSEAAVTALGTAALLGDGAPVDVVGGVQGLTGSELDAVLAELEQRDLLVERAEGRYWFTRSAIRQHLVRSMSPRSRRARHRDIATYLARRSADEPTRPIEVAHHLGRAGTTVDPGERLEWERRAVRRSLELGAWSRAARHAEAALGVLDELDVPATGSRSTEDETVRRSLLLDAALAHFRNHDATAAERACLAAVASAEVAGDLETWGRALLIRHRSLLTLGQGRADGNTHRDLRRFVDAVGDAVPAIRARCWELLAEIAVSDGELDVAEVAADHAGRLASTLGDDVLAAETEFARGLARLGAFDLDAAMAHFDASEAHARAGGDEWILAWPMIRRGLVEFTSGHLEAAEEVLAEATALCERTQHWAEGGLSLALRAGAAMTASDTAEADRRAEHALACHRRSGFPFIARLAWPVVVYARALRQDRLGAYEELDRWRDADVGGSERFRVLVDALTTSADDFAGAFDHGRYRPASKEGIHLYRSGMVEVDVEVGCRLHDPVLLRGALDVLAELAARRTELLLPVGSSVDRLRGMALHGLGEHDEADVALQRTAWRMREIGAHREALRCDVERCIVLADVGDSRVAALGALVVEALDEASSLALFQRLREHLPEDVAHSFRLHRTVVCWDIVDSTRRLVAVGDAAFVSVLHDLDTLLRRRLDAHRGQAFKHTGDGIVAWFHDEADALRCVRDVARDLDRWSRRDPETSVRMRAGVASGEPVDDAGDLFGVAVVTAVRLCDRARNGEVALCTAEVAAAARDAVPVRPFGEIELKGLAAPMVVLEVLDEPV